MGSEQSRRSSASSLPTPSWVPAELAGPCTGSSHPGCVFVGKPASPYQERWSSRGIKWERGQLGRRKRQTHTHTHTHTHRRTTLSGTFWSQKNMLAKVNRPQWLTYGAHSHHCWGALCSPRCSSCEPLVVTSQAQAGWMMFSLSPALPRLPWAPHLWPLVAPSLSRDPPSHSPTGKREPRACAPDMRGHRAVPRSSTCSSRQLYNKRREVMKLSDTETEPQAHPVILAPPHSKWSYYLLTRECGKGGFNLNEPALTLKTALNAIKPDGNLPMDFPLQSSFSL